ncbi:MAG: hypothetical protein ACXAC7_06985 [Candidatus Hodarchaeales archaeon]|jgi:hypothetical protein
MYSLTDIEILIDNNLTITEENKGLDVLEELLPLLEEKSLIRSFAIFQIWLAYNYFNSSDPTIKEKAIDLVKDFINSFKSDEVEIFRPCMDIEWFLNDFGKKMISSETKLAKELLRITLDLVKTDNDQQKIAVVSFNLAMAYFKNKEKIKAARLFEITSSLFENPEEKVQCLELAASIYYPQKIEQTIKLLENSLYILSKTEKIDPNLVRKLNDIRRDYILSYEGENHSILFDLIKELTQSYHEQQDWENLAACYYEAGIILEKLSYHDVAYQYMSESARLSAENDLWKLYSKSTLQIAMQTIEARKFSEADEILKDLDQVGHYLKDQTLIKQVDSLFQALQKLKLKLAPPELPTPSNEVILDSSPISESTHDISQTEPTLPQEKDDTKISEQLKESIETIKIETSSITNEIKERAELEILSEEKVIEERIEDETPAEQDFFQIRNQIANYLISNGYEVQLDETPFRGTITIDIIASKGKVRKKKRFLMVANHPPEASISVNLLRGLTETGKKYVFLQSGDPRLVSTTKAVKIVTDTSEIVVQ